MRKLTRRSMVKLIVRSGMASQITALFACAPQTKEGAADNNVPWTIDLKQELPTIEVPSYWVFFPVKKGNRMTDLNVTNASPNSQVTITLTPIANEGKRAFEAFDENGSLPIMIDANGNGRLSQPLGANRDSLPAGILGKKNGRWKYSVTSQTSSTGRPPLTEPEVIIDG